VIARGTHRSLKKVPSTTLCGASATASSRWTKLHDTERDSTQLKWKNLSKLHLTIPVIVRVNWSQSAEIGRLL
jgi:hypothetical protein